MSALHIAANLSLPLELVTQTVAILAKRGSGKTYTALTLVEEMLKAGQQVAVVDPVGVCWGLRSSADGQSEGLQIVILGGEHGDVPLEETAGEIIADLVVQERLSVVLDLSLFRKNQQRRFMTDFAERLYQTNRAPLHLVLDEADMFAPQRPLKGAERLLGAIEDLVRRGRARGLGITMVTQRPAVINKDVLTQIEVLVALRTVGKPDLEAVDAWTRVHGTPAERDALMSSLPSLPVGTAWFWSPGWLDIFQKVEVRKRETFDSSATPKVGEQVIKPTAIADVDLDAVRERIAGTIERAEAEDPKVLKRRIVELEKRLAAQPREVERVEVPVVPESLLSQVAEAITVIAADGESLLKLANQLRANLICARKTMEVPAPQRTTRVEATPGGPGARGPFSNPAKRARSFSNDNPSELNLKAGERKMLRCLARIDFMLLTRQQLATLSGFTVTGGTFGTYLGNLKRHDLIHEEGGEIGITERGLAEIGTSILDEPQTTDELVAMWSASLKAGERAMLAELVDVYPASMSRDSLGLLTGFTVSGGTFGTYLGRLRKNGLIEVDGGEVRASDTLFLGEKASE